VESETETKTPAPSGLSVWRTACCDDCGWEIEVSPYGDRTLCACDVAA